MMIKRSISEGHLLRLQAQLEEAKVLKLDVTKPLETEVAAQSIVRKDNDFYLYTEAELKNDLRGLLWAAATRVSDYLGVVPDVRDIDAAVDAHAEALFKELSVAANVPDGVGAYEPTVPGEHRQSVILEVTDDE